MNPFSELEAAVRGGLAAMTAAGTLPAGLDLGRVVVEPPRDPAFGDATTNAAMILAKPAGLRPMELATGLAEALAGRSDIVSAAAAPPLLVSALASGTEPAAPRPLQ